ncbi:MAG: hypothetical protein ACI4UE_02255 [Candidatus Scatovivens sp.]
MESNIKLSITMDLLNKEIAKINSKLVKAQNDSLNDKLKYLLNLKASIYLGDLSGVDEFLEKYKESNL